MKSKLEIKWRKGLGEKLNTITNGVGEALNITTFENGFLLKRINRGEIVLDRFDLMCLKDIIVSFEKKKDILKALED